MTSTEVKIDNAPKHKGKLISAIRGTLEHRAMWLYLLLDEAEKKGLTWEDFAGAAVGRCGCIQGAELRQKAGTTSLKGLQKTLFNLPARMVFEMDLLACDDDHMSLDFHHCPLVAAWQKLGCTTEEIGRLCDIAMDGDRAIAQSFGCTLELGDVIAKGGKTCQLRFTRDETKENR